MKQNDNPQPERGGEMATRHSSGVKHQFRYHLDNDHRYAERAEAIADTYLDTIVDSIVSQPRSLQKRAGPSELGHPCNKKIIYKLAGVPDPPRKDIPWKPAIGTAGHSWLEDVFTKSASPGMEEEGRWLIEERVIVGEIGGVEISGSTDLFDTFGNAVLDHKFCGKFTMKKYRASGPSDQYRIQSHLYGKGWEDDGYQVDLVMICFLPREGDFTDSFIWSEPYDRSVAVRALERANKLDALWKALGPETAAGLYPPCEDMFCPWCGTGSAWTPAPPAATTADLFK